MMTFNVGDRVYHKTIGSTQLGSVIGTRGGSAIIVWDIGTHIRNIAGPEGYHATQFLALCEPAFSQYDPTQMGDREDDI